MPAAPLDPSHPVVAWVRRELLPLLAEQLAPEKVIVFDPPDRPAGIDASPPGIVVVATRFRGVAMLERNALIRQLLAAVSPVRPICLTPEEFALIDQTPGPILAAVRLGVEI